MLKSALAYVVVRARQKKRTQLEKAAGDVSSTTSYDTNDNGGKRSRTGSSLIATFESSPLDRILQCSDKDVIGGPVAVEENTAIVLGDDGPSNSSSIVSLTSSLLRRQGTDSTVHLDHMFKVSCSLAKSVLIRRQSHGESKSKRGSNDDDGSAALIGATTHLSQQLNTLLLMEQEREKKEKKKGGRGRSDRRDSGGLIGSKLSMEKSKNRSPSVVVLPAMEEFQSIQPPLSQTKPSPPAAMKTQQGEVTKPSDINNSSSKNSTNNKATDRQVVNVGSWIFSSLKASADISDIRAAFFVYQTMLPYAGMNHPALIRHVFLIVSNMIRELYDDQMFVRHPSSGRSSHQTATVVRGINNDQFLEDTKTKILTLNVLAVESLRLLESCWLANVPHDVEKKHRDFLLLTLQDKLGDLLSPLPLSAVACTYDQCSRKTSKLIKHKRHQDRLLLQRQQQHAAVLAGRHNNNNNERSPHSDTRSTISINSNDKIHSEQYLDPGAKLIMRLGVYKLLGI
jgi:hypothetical protein